MKIKIFLSAVAFLTLTLPLLLHADVAYVSEQQLTEQADLVISGKVVQVESAGKDVVKTIVTNSTTPVMLATIKVDKVMKGSLPEMPVVIEFGKMILGLEADVQDSQFSKGSQGVAYLVKLPNGHYEALGGWLRGWDTSQAFVGGKE